MYIQCYYRSPIIMKHTVCGILGTFVRVCKCYFCYQNYFVIYVIFLSIMFYIKILVCRSIIHLLLLFLNFDSKTRLQLFAKMHQNATHFRNPGLSSYCNLRTWWLSSPLIFVIQFGGAVDTKMKLKLSIYSPIATGAVKLINNHFPENLCLYRRTRALILGQKMLFCECCYLNHMFYVDFPNRKRN